MKYALLLLITITCAIPLYSQTAEEYYNEAFKAFQAGNSEEQIKYAEKAIAIYEITDNYDENYFVSFLILSEGLKDLQKFEEAIHSLESAEKRIKEKQSEIYATILNNLGMLYYDVGDYSKAKQLYEDASDIYGKVFSTEHPSYANSLDNLAILYESMGDYSKAQELAQEVFNIRKRVLGPGHPDYASSLNYLASLYKSMGDYTKAELFYLESLEVKKNILGLKHPSYALSLNNLAELYKSLRDYSKAEPLYLEALDICQSILGTNHSSYATVLNNLAGLYQNQGNYSKAELLYHEAINIIKKVLGTESLQYTGCLDNLAGLYSSVGEYSKAESLYLETVDILKRVYGTNHLSYATTLNNLAEFYRYKNNNEKAKPLYLEALKIYTDVFGNEHPSHATILNNLALLNVSMGDYSKAEPLYIEAINIIKKALGLKHPSYALYLNNLAELYSTTENPGKAISLQKEALAIIQEHTKKTFSTLSESEKTIFSGKDDGLYEAILSTSSFIPEHEKMTIYDRLLFRKGLVINSSVNTRSFILSSNDAILKQKYSDWISTKQVINNLYSKTIEQRSKTGLSLDSLEELANTLEKELSKMSSTFKDFVMIPDFKWEDVRKNLKEDEAVVEFVKYKLYDKRWTDTTRYGVFVTTGNSTKPLYFEFKDGNRIDTLIIPKLNEKNGNKFYEEPKTGEEANVIVLNDETEPDFYTELFSPIAENLNGVKKIYFSLDGEFYKVNFNTLRNPDTGKYLIEDYEIVYVSSANEIARGNKETIPNKSAVLTGFPNYDLSLDSLTAIIKMEQGAEKSRDVYVYTSKIQKYTLDLLPGTKEEVTVTSELLKKNGWEVSSWLFNEATESKIKSVSAPGLLSISTHGFFSPSPKTDYTDNYFMGSETKKAIENPLLRSGLFLTGAETFLNSDETQKNNFTENGILTAYEASQLNLLGTDIVILSACETGLGEVNNGEGVFGLQRGFFGAGAKSVLMSLWKVDDTATRDLMIEFIKNYSTSMNKQQSLRDAQLTIMKKYPQPYYWGAFVMVGM